MKIRWYKKCLVVGIIVLFIGISVYPAIAVSSYVALIEDNHPPNVPKIKGQAFIIPAKLYNYTFNATDPDGDNVSYEIDWGDGTSEKWIGPYASGEEIIRNHTFMQKRTFVIRARAKDIHGAIGDWGYLIINSKGKQMNNLLIIQILEQFPLLEVFLRVMNL